jgi:hypothetical protein
MDVFKGDICDGAIKYLKEHSGYRWTDVLDYICDNWDLDNEFDSLIEDACQKNYNLSYEDFKRRSLAETKYKLDRLPIKDEFITLFGKQLVERFEESLKHVY